MSQPVTVELINTGNELLLGQVLNTHLRVISEELLPLGIRLARQQTLGDGEALREPLQRALGRSDVVLLTGGLGPTTDDLTREITADLLNRELIEDPEITQSIRARLAARGYSFLERIRRQAMVPRGAKVLPNAKGTAPGLLLNTNDFGRPCALFLLPGPPTELVPMLKSHVVPELRRYGVTDQPPAIRTYRIIGIGESAVEDKIGLAIEERGDLEVGYCARAGEVDLRLIGKQSALDAVDHEVREAAGHHLYSTSGESLAEVVVREFTAHKKTLATAESCTGGFLASTLTDVAGSSSVLIGGVVTYANRAKASELQVPTLLIEEHGAVSAEVAIAMAEGLRQRMNVSHAISLTGIAGPSGGSEAKPVGTLFIGVASATSTTAHRFHLPLDRQTFKAAATQQALNLLRLSVTGVGEGHVTDD